MNLCYGCRRPPHTPVWLSTNCLRKTRFVAEAVVISKLFCHSTTFPLLFNLGFVRIGTYHRSPASVSLSRKSICFVLRIIDFFCYSSCHLSRHQLILINGEMFHHNYLWRLSPVVYNGNKLLPAVHDLHSAEPSGRILSVPARLSIEKFWIIFQVACGFLFDPASVTSCLIPSWWCITFRLCPLLQMDRLATSIDLVGVVVFGVNFLKIIKNSNLLRLLQYNLKKI